MRIQVSRYVPQEVHMQISKFAGLHRRSSGFTCAYADDSLPVTDPGNPESCSKSTRIGI